MYHFSTISTVFQQYLNAILVSSHRLEDELATAAKAAYITRWTNFIWAF